jgi:hypothetical protein
MKTQIIPLICVLLVLTCRMAAADTQVITLKDGSQIKGELSGVANGVYTVRTPTLGDIHITSNQVISISAETAGAAVASPPAANASANAMPAVPALPGLPAAGASGDMSQRITSAQNQLMANPEFVAEIQNFAQDPEITQLLSDPQLMQEIMSKDVNAIQKDPKAQALMNNPKMQALVEKLRGNTQK